MRVLLSLNSPGTAKNLESTIALLASRGHTVDVLFHRSRGAPGTDAIVERLELLDGVTVRWADERAEDSRLAMNVRSALDYLRFQTAAFPPAYGERSERRVSRRFSRFTGLPGVRSKEVLRVLTAMLEHARASIAPTPGIVDRVRSLAPDVALFSPLVHLRSVQPDYLCAAASLGVPTGMIAYSWDNLTSKTLIRPAPDNVFVWNDEQAREAVEIHGIDPGDVVVTGAQCFDEWFERTPTAREAFCRRVGLDPDRPFFTWLCFSPFQGTNEPDETVVVREWVKRVRASADPAVAGAGLLIRPHPKRPDPWRTALGDAPVGVTVWPREGSYPTDEASKSDFFDSLHHAAAVVGINTSAMIEAGIVGRPVLTLLSDAHRESQEATLHFRYMLETAGGLVRPARSFDEHLSHLSAALVGALPAPEAFVRAFVRPLGLDVTATPVLVDAIENLGHAGGRRAPGRSPGWRGRAAALAARAVVGVGKAQGRGGGRR